MKDDYTCDNRPLAMAVATRVAAAVASSATIPRERVLSPAIMPGIAFVPMRIHTRIRVEVIEWLFSMTRHRAVVTMARIEAIIYVSIKSTMPMEPRPRANKQATVEPIRAVVAIRSAVVRRVIKVSVRTHWLRPDVDGNLSWRNLRAHNHANCEA